MHFNAKLYNTMDQPWETILNFLDKTLPEYGFKVSLPNTKAEVVMDVGCGPGYLSKNYILPCFPNLEKMIAFDATPSMIEEAKIRHPHPKITYAVADIQEKSSVQEWIGEITKLIAIFSFNWLKNLKKGFENVYDLLKPGGEAALLFPLDGAYYDGLIETAKNTKFSSFCENADLFIPDSYYQKYDSSHYRKMLKEIGFEIMHCKDEIKEDILHSDEELRDIFYSVCPLVKYLPDNLKSDFKEELFQNILKQNGRVKDGRPIYRGKTIEILIRKRN